MQTTPATTTTTTTDAAHTDGRDDFDPLLGRWTIANDRLRSRLTACTEWEQFDARGICRPILGGLGNIDDFIPLGDVPGWIGFEGGSLRIFNPASGQWTIFWFDTTTCALTPPLVGAFTPTPDGNLGTFFSDELFNGIPIRVRFLWDVRDVDHLRWEQAFSSDDGRTWETNWIMRFTRAA